MSIILCLIKLWNNKSIIFTIVILTIKVKFPMLNMMTHWLALGMISISTLVSIKKIIVKLNYKITSSLFNQTCVKGFCMCDVCSKETLLLWELSPSIALASLEESNLLDQSIRKIKDFIKGSKTWVNQVTTQVPQESQMDEDVLVVLGVSYKDKLLVMENLLVISFFIV